MYQSKGSPLLVWVDPFLLSTTTTGIADIRYNQSQQSSNVHPVCLKENISTATAGDASDINNLNNNSTSTSVIPRTNSQQVENFKTVSQLCSENYTFGNINSIVEVFPVVDNVFKTDVLHPDIFKDVVSISVFHEVYPQSSFNTYYLESSQAKHFKHLGLFSTTDLRTPTSDLHSDSNLHSSLNSNSNDLFIKKSFIVSDDSTKTIPRSELFAGDPMYTVDGSLIPQETSIKPWTFASTMGAYLGAMVGLHIFQVQTFWAVRSPVFRVYEDGDYAQYVDKLGHFFGAHTISNFATDFLMTSGFARRPARLWGGLMGIVYQTYVEIEDGWGVNWGFSPSDFYFNLIGTSYFILQEYIPFLQNFNPRWLYTPSRWIGEQTRVQGQTFIDDYSSSTFYLSANLYNLLPESARSYWVPWLNIAVGYASRNLGHQNQSDRFSIGLDYNMVALLPDFEKLLNGSSVGSFLNWIKQSLNILKFPAPMLEISQQGHTRLRLFYPFTIEIGSAIKL